MLDLHYLSALDSASRFFVANIAIIHVISTTSLECFVSACVSVCVCVSVCECVCVCVCTDFPKDCLSIQCHTHVDLLVKEEIRMSHKLYLFLFMHGLLFAEL